MSTVRANFGELLEPGLKAIWGMSYDKWSPEYEQIFDVQSSSRSFEETLGIKTFGQFSEKTEGASVAYADPAQSYTGRLTHATYGLGFQVSREMVEDDQYGKIRQMPGALAESAQNTVEAVAQEILNDAFDSGTGPDGSYLCVSDHALAGGGSDSNILSTAADLSITSYKQALIDIASFTDDAGKKIMVKAQKLIIPADLEFEAKQIIKSSGLPKTGDNDINPVQNSAEIVVGHWLSDSDAWFIKTNVRGLMYFWRRRPEFGMDNDFDGENAKYKSTFRMSVGWDDWRAIFGTPGA